MFDWKSEATSASRRAGNFTRRAEAEARKADEAYRTSRRWTRQARQLTANQRLAWESYNPATLEANAQTWARIGDTYLRSSFWSTEMAARYRADAARYRELAK